MNSRQKGARGERDAAAAWAAAVGGHARRGQQFAGSPNSPDVVCSQEKIHLEVKRVERGNPYLWLEQAVQDAGGKIPVVLHRRNHQDWIVIARLSDVRRLAEEIGSQASTVGDGSVPGSIPTAGLPATGLQDGGSPGILQLRR